ncbi:unnamed protein product [Bursaphelenchus okinawaensis]|uniref:MAM domain-containing protein n=1 Tax=Bursaphelenchus okinawaensis TaxID=465554 RepID=A0A811JQ44_9BILA|nr:unnamed protein product [Bursaphelenchus okinawaensis]CAG9077527.1 unnamed protein product [Bursaphelenchus okinawaensis]
MLSIRIWIVPLLLLPPVLAQSPIDCNFDDNEDVKGPLCGWKPDEEGSQIWHTGNAVLVDSAHSIIKPGKSNDRFAFVQGQFGSSEGQLVSPILRTAPGMTNQLRFSYWKSAFEPILDICLKYITEDRLDCIDAIIGGGEEKWVKRALDLPSSSEPFSVVFRARGIHSKEDLIGLDDIKLALPEDEEQIPDTNELAGFEPKYGIKKDLSEYGNPSDERLKYSNPNDSGSKHSNPNSGGFKYSNPTDDNSKYSNLKDETSKYRNPTDSRPQYDMKTKDSGAKSPFKDSESKSAFRSFDENSSYKHSEASNSKKNRELKPVLTSKATYERIGLSETEKSAGINSFEMRRSQPVIRPNKNPFEMDEERLPLQEEEKPIQLSERSYPDKHDNSNSVLSQFPDFPSLDTIRRDEDHHLPKDKLAEDTFTCKAVKCTFLETTCFWSLNNKWNKGDGSVALEAKGNEKMVSGIFRAPPGQYYIDFDVWMSDNTELKIVQITEDVGEEVQFQRQGGASDRYHTYRAPIHGALTPIRIEFQASLPAKAFLTLSNTRLVDPSGEEMACETLGFANITKSLKPESNGINGNVVKSRPVDNPLWPTFPPPLLGNPFVFPPLGVPLQPLPAPPAILTPFNPFAQTNFNFGNTLDNTVSSPSISTPNSITPITPMKDSTTRLTAVQQIDENKSYPAFTFPTLPPMPVFGVPNVPTMFPSVLKPMSTKPQPHITFVDATTVEKFHDFPSNDADLVTKPSKIIGRPKSVQARWGTAQMDSVSHQHHQMLENLEKDGVLDKILQNPIARPIIEGQIKRLAAQYGLDSNAFTDPRQMEQIKRLVGPKMFSKLPGIINGMPKNVVSTDREEMALGAESGEVSKVQPIRPVNVDKDDFERVMKQLDQTSQTEASPLVQKLFRTLGGQSSSDAFDNAIADGQRMLV